MCGREANLEAMSGVVMALEAAPLRGPVDKALHVFAVFPGEMKKLARGQVRRLLSKKRLKSPAHVGTLPWLQAVTPCRIPVVTQRLKHFLAPERIAQPSV
jgi:hypothetical protein